MTNELPPNDENSKQKPEAKILEFSRRKSKPVKHEPWDLSTSKQEASGFVAKVGKIIDFPGNFGRKKISSETNEVAGKVVEFLEKDERENEFIFAHGYEAGLNSEFIEIYIEANKKISEQAD